MDGQSAGAARELVFPLARAPGGVGGSWRREAEAGCGARRSPLRGWASRRNSRTSASLLASRHAPASDRRRRPPQARPRAGARRVLSQARRGDRARARSARRSKSSKFAKAARRMPSGGASRNRSRSPMSFPMAPIVVVLDERGENLDSAALAGLLREWRAEDRAAVCFIIGGADGARAKPARARQGPARLRRGDLAASTGAHHAARAALPRRHDPCRSPLSSGLTPAMPRDRPEFFVISPHRFVTDRGVRVLFRTHRSLFCAVSLAFPRLASTLGQHDSPPVEPHRSAPCARLGLGVCAADWRRPRRAFAQTFAGQVAVELAPASRPPRQVPPRRLRQRRAGRASPAKTDADALKQHDQELDAVRAHERDVGAKARRSCGARSRRSARIVARSISNSSIPPRACAMSRPASTRRGRG